MQTAVARLTPNNDIRSSIPGLSTRERWLIFALSESIERTEMAECAAARNRLVLARLEKINGVMVRNVMASQP